MKVLLKLFLGVTLLLIVFVYGAAVGKYQLFPYGMLRSLGKTVTSGGFGQYDDYGRLVGFSFKTPVLCPSQGSRTGVLLFIGQSNSANHSQHMVRTIYPEKVFNYFSGKCYIAQSPHLGASGQNGEYATLVADKLIKNNTFDNIIIISSGIGGSSVSQWAEGGDLNKMLRSVIDEFSADVSITDIIWHQGESDAFYTPYKEKYMDRFLSLMATLKEREVNAPIYMSIASLCKNFNVQYPNEVTRAQAQLINDHDNIFLGVNTDEIVINEYRHDGCHFGRKGQEVTAAEIANAITRLKKEKTGLYK